MGAWHLKKLYRNGNWSNSQQLDKKTLNTWPVCGNKKTFVPSKTFCAGITTRTLLLRSKLRKRWLIWRQWRNWHYKAWMYFAKSCKYLSSQVNYCKALSSYRERQGFTAKILEDVVVGTSLLFTKKVVVDETFRDSTNWCKSIVGIDASQLCPFSLSCNANWSVHKMAARFEIWQI